MPEQHCVELWEHRCIPGGGSCPNVAANARVLHASQELPCLLQSSALSHRHEGDVLQRHTASRGSARQEQHPTFENLLLRPLRCRQRRAVLAALLCPPGPASGRRVFSRCSCSPPFFLRAETSQARGPVRMHCYSVPKGLALKVPLYRRYLHTGL